MILEIPNNEYHARDEISNSQLKLMGISPAHFKAGHSGINPDIARIGTAVHSTVLERGKGLVVIAESRKRASKDDRKWWHEYFLDNYSVNVDTTKPAATWFPEFERLTGLVVVTVEEKREQDAMLESLDKNQLACDLLKDTTPELSVIGEINGVPCRSRPDASNPSRIVDVKSCADASERAFRRDCAKLGYHRQDDFYSRMHYDAYKQWPEFYFIAMGKTKPYPCVVYMLDDEAKENGGYLNERDLEKYQACVKSGKWPSFDNNTALSIPIWEESVFTYDLGEKELLA